MKFEAMSNRAIAQEIGQRLEKLRLEQNLTQQQVCDEVGLTPVSYRKLVDGKGKFENLIGVLRALKHLDLVETFVPEVEFSPMQRLQMQGKQRQRARPAKGTSGQVKESAKTGSQQVNEEDLDW